MKHSSTEAGFPVARAVVEVVLVAVCVSLVQLAALAQADLSVVLPEELVGPWHSELADYRFDIDDGGLVLYNLTGDEAYPGILDGLELFLTWEGETYRAYVDLDGEGTPTQVVFEMGVALIPGSRAGALGRVHVSQIDVAIHRRAAQLFEEARGGAMAPNWEDAQLGEYVTPLYRPDIAGVAYYEFEVAPEGFIIVATGEHDFPVCHWSPTGATLTEQLDQEADRDGRTAATYYRLDALTYVAESADGLLVAGGEKLPPRIATDGVLADIVYGQDVSVGTGPLGGEAQASPEGRPVVWFDEWSSWDELKSEFESEYAVGLQGLRSAASGVWEADELIRQSGEGLIPGDMHRVPLLYADATWEVTGEGSRYAVTEEISRPGEPSILEIYVTSAPDGRDAQLDLKIYYRDQSIAETLRFAAIDPKIIQMDPEDPELREVAFVCPGVGLGVGFAGTNGWSKWYVYEAGGKSDQRFYEQFMIQEEIVDLLGLIPKGAYSLCKSGCGPTAWAMLFGWIDHMASSLKEGWGDWAGIYLQDGGTPPSPDVEAPKSNDAGVRNMIEEINEDLGTWCDSGATPPWDMVDAIEYLNSRVCCLTLHSYYTGLGWDSSDLRSKAYYSIAFRHTPAIIGTGWWSHYPLAWGYEWRTKTIKYCGWWIITVYDRNFEVNQGWGGSGNGWIPANTWYYGSVTRN